MKRTLIAAILLITAFGAFAETFRLKSGAKIRGEVISQTEDECTVQTKDGFVTIQKDEIVRMRGKNVPDFRSNFSALEDNIEYHAYKRNFGIGLGFFIPGTILMAIPTIFATGGVVWTMLNMNFYANNAYIAGITSYFLCIGIGAILDIISIPFFITADGHYRKAIEQAQISFDAEIGKESLKVAMNISF